MRILDLHALPAGRNRRLRNTCFRLGVGTMAWLVFSCALAADQGAKSSTARYLDSSSGADWAGFGRTYGEQHFSPLDEVDQQNVGKLKLAWYLDLGPENSVTQPIAVDGVFYCATGHSVVRAVDARTGKLLWQYDPRAAEKAGLNLRIGAGSRGLAWWNGRIYVATQDGRLIAIDAKTGAELWSKQTLDQASAAYITGAPRVFDNKVIVGFGSDSGVNRAYVTAYDALTGRKLWRFFVVPGNPADGFENPAMKMAAKTWAGDWWKFGGGGAVWNAMAYDPQTDTIFFGTGNGWPANRRVRSADRGDNLFIASILALRGSTGEYRWHYQLNPGDTWDYDATNDIQLADLPIQGRMRKVLLQAPKNGFFYVIDRLTGKLISAEPYVRQTWATRIDTSTGRPIENADARYAQGKTVEIYPSSYGAHTWLPMAYSQRTKLVYIPVVESMGMPVNDAGIDPATWTPPTDRSPLAGNALNMGFDPTTDASGALIAWNPVTQRAAWRVPHQPIVIGGVLATAGDLVFQGSIDGKFKAYSATDGSELWSYIAQAPVIAPPITYSVNGHQYVSLLTGLGTAVSFMAFNLEQYDLDPRSQLRRILTFSLNGDAVLPPHQRAALPIPDDPEFKQDIAVAAAGEATFARNCMACHGAAAIATGHAPDLRRSPILLAPALFASIVRDGARVPNAMPAFGEFTDGQLSAVRQYLRTQAARLRSKEDGTSGQSLPVQ